MRIPPIRATVLAFTCFAALALMPARLLAAPPPRRLRVLHQPVAEHLLAVLDLFHGVQLVLY